MSDLLAWLRERLDEDEQMAKAATEGPWKGEGTVVTDSDGRVLVQGDTYSELDPATRDHIARHNPKRTLATVAGHREILELHKPGFMDHFCDACRSSTDWPCPTLFALAKCYADRAGYRHEWAV